MESIAHESHYRELDRIKVKIKVQFRRLIPSFAQSLVDWIRKPFSIPPFFPGAHSEMPVELERDGDGPWETSRWVRSMPARPFDGFSDSKDKKIPVNLHQ